jgi:hypothetical protein
MERIAVLHDANKDWIRRRQWWVSPCMCMLKGQHALIALFVALYPEECA